MLSQDSNSSGWYNSEKWQEQIAQWAQAESEEERQQILAGLNETLYEELPFEKVTNISNLNARTTDLHDYSEWYGPRFWNTYKTN